MSFISPFAIVLILYICYEIYKKKSVKISDLFKCVFVTYLVTSMTVNTGYAFKIGNSLIAFNTFLSLILLVLGILLIFLGKYNFKILGLGVLFYVAVGIGLILFKVNPYHGGVAQNIEEWDRIIRGDGKIDYYPTLPSNLFNMLLGVIRFPVILSAAISVYDKKDIRKIVSGIYRFSDLIIIYGLMEIIIKKVLKLAICNSFVNIFFGNIGAGGSPDRLSGFTKEPSQYAMVLFAYSIIIIAENRFRLSKYFDDDALGIKKDKRKVYLWIKLALVYSYMFLSGSVAAYYLLIVSIFLLLVTEHVSRKVLVLSGAVGLAFIILLVGIPSELLTRFDRINDVFVSIKEGKTYQSFATSEGARIISIYRMLLCFISRPLFGVGLGVNSAHSTFFSILGNLGLTGTCLYFAMWRSFSGLKSFKTRKYFWIIFASTLLVGGMGYFMDMYLPFLILALNTSELRRSDI